MCIVDTMIFTKDGVKKRKKETTIRRKFLKYSEIKQNSMKLLGGIKVWTLDKI